jgi:anti-sigma B factor antagonist
MEIQETRQGAVTVVRPQGPLALGDAEQFKGVIEDVIRRSLGRLVVDAGAIAYVDSRGLEVLVEASDSLSQTGRALHMCGANETIREVLHLTGLEDRFEHYEDVNAAVRSFL